MSEKLVLIDGHSILNRAFYGVPELTNAKGFHTNAIYGFLNIMFKILEEEKPQYLAVAFDVHAPTFRHLMYEGYKGTRKAMPDELREQVPVMKDVLRAMGVVIMEHAGLEADDILGTLARKAEKAGMEVALVSGDRDLLQIASEHIKIRIPKTKMGRTEVEDYYAEDVLKVYHVTPTQFIDLKALMGDTSDNIPGVPKIGEKTTAGLMEEYGSLENIYAHVDEISKKSIRESLIANRDLADLSKALATIKVDSDVELNLEEARAEGYYTKEAYALFKELEFKNMLSRFDTVETEYSSKVTDDFAVCSSADELVMHLKEMQTMDEIADSEAATRIGLSFLTGEAGDLLAVAAAEPKGSVFVYTLQKEEEKQVAEALHQLSGRMPVAAFDIKRMYGFLQQECTDRYFDVLIGAYLLNPLKNDYDIEAIAQEHLDMMIPGYGELFGKLSPVHALLMKQEEMQKYLCYSAFVARKATVVLEKKLLEAGMDQLMRQIEMPLSLVLYDMEREGVRVKREELKKYGDALVERIDQLEQAIHEQAGSHFNINSPKQLGEILFDKMKLPGGKKTKTGYSTAAEVLEKLAPEHAIVKDILEYRGLAKLKSTYADGLAVYIGADERIHTSFNQTITATGRISSTEPNLQNIPMRMELGRKIRKVFVPGVSSWTQTILR